MKSGKSGIDGSSQQSVTKTFKAADLEIEMVQGSAKKPDPNQIVFGTFFSDHMLMIQWTIARGWERPQIKPLQNLSLHPAVSALHYSVESFDPNELLECIRKLVEIDREWVPYSNAASLYIRPVLIGTEPSLGLKLTTKALLYVILSPVGPYFSSESFNPISLWADPKYIRAWKGGTGDCKLGGNYGASLFAQSEALAAGCQQVLWLYGEEHNITEAGTMNLFLYWINENGEEELVTPPLDGVILPGVVRQSILDLTRKWNQFKVEERSVTMKELLFAMKQNRVKEMFGSGTACILCPISHILYQGENLHIPTIENGPKLTMRLFENLADIQYGRIKSDWAFLVV
ncbi:branched-chain-amino-acid aminotransferase, cytosolic isoform X4 [Stegostoma tigrinum]|uniref:branched-chain-amino-acid aminotransferase, cytosolic isoform X4 n=1 Tax=Stegostoma tigrinum TaxID=3053191 RepID=UPI00202B4060|nr:branched-chain-amino-acid aminotransferase, cytosolic isoform X4 [Stegostoma tigrinum]